MERKKVRSLSSSSHLLSPGIGSRQLAFTTSCKSDNDDASKEERKRETIEGGEKEMYECTCVLHECQIEEEWKFEASAAVAVSVCPPPDLVAPFPPSLFPLLSVAYATNCQDHLGFPIHSRARRAFLSGWKKEKGEEEEESIDKRWGREREHNLQSSDLSLTHT